MWGASFEVPILLHPLSLYLLTLQALIAVYGTRGSDSFHVSTRYTLVGKWLEARCMRSRGAWQVLGTLCFKLPFSLEGTREETADCCWLNNTSLHNGMLLIKKIFSAGFVGQLLLLMAVRSKAL